MKEEAKGPKGRNRIPDQRSSHPTVCFSKAT